jgi:hypothetical protein
VAFLAFLAAAVTGTVLGSFPSTLQLMIGGVVGLGLFVAFLYWADREIALSILDILGVPVIVARLKLFYLALHGVADSLRKADG